MKFLGAAVERTVLFVPADRPERFDKARQTGADLVVLDLEDAVHRDHKLSARLNAVEYLRAGNHCAVRINAVGTQWFHEDVEAMAMLNCTVMLPKSDLASVTRCAELLPRRKVIALIETARGVLEAAPIAKADGVTRLALGAIDLASELAVDPDLSPLIDRARCELSFASAAAGLPGPIDGVTPAIDDAARLLSDVARGRLLGFAGKLCIHPRQIEPTHTAMSPTQNDIDWAKKVLAAAADPSNGSVFTLDGAMVDKPIVDRADAILERAQEVH